MKKFRFFLLTILVLLTFNTAYAETIDGFESGSFTDGNPAVWQVVSGTFAASTEQAYAGSWSLKESTAGQIFTQTNASNGEFGTEYYAWIRAGSTAQADYAMYILDQSDQNSGWPDYIGMRLDYATDEIQLHVRENSSTTTYTVLSDWNFNQWYRLQMNFNWALGTVTGTAYNDSNALLGTSGARDFKETQKIYRVRLITGGNNVVYNDNVIVNNFGSIVPDFNIIPSIIPGLDPENAVNDFNLDFNDLSVSGIGDINSWVWNFNNTQFSTDQNTTHIFETTGDFNVSLFVQDTNNNFAQIDKNINVGEYPQDVNFTWVEFKPFPFTDVNFFATTSFDENSTHWYWEFPDGNLESTTDQNVQYSFSESGLQEVCLTVQNLYDFNKTTCYDVNVQLSLRVRFFDENNGQNLQPTVTVNGTDYSGSVQADGSLVLEINPGTYTIVASDTNYGERTWVFDVNGTANVDYNVALISTSLGKFFDFKFYAPDKTTLLTDANLDVDFNSWLISRRDLSATAETSIFLRMTAFEYNFLLNRNGTDYNYVGTDLTVKVPLDLSDTSVSLTPFDITVTNQIDYSYQNLTADDANKIYSDTSGFYLYTVDSNSDYYATDKLFRELGGTATDEWQPYLVPKDTEKGILVTIYTIDNKNDRRSLPNIRIEALTNIGTDVNVLVSSKFSDGTGTAQIAFDLSKTYILKFYQGDELKLELIYEPGASSNFFAYIETGTFTEFGTVGGVQVEWYHSPTNAIPSISGIVSLYQILKPLASTIGLVDVVVSQNDVNVYSNTFNVNSSTDYNLAYDFNVSDLNSYQPIRVDLTAYDDLNQVIFSGHAVYTIVPDNLFGTAVTNLRESLGIFMTTILSLLFSLFIVRIVMKYRATEPDNNFVVVVPIIFLGILAFLGFIPMHSWVFGGLFGISIAVWRVKD